ncbi:MAG: hypothetical protein ABR902_06755 [Candidatus Korobacteraceae bacterium]|jgi:hypothetical protein
MLRFNTLLEEAGFNPKKVLLLRHEDRRLRPGQLYQAWKSAPKDFEAYQNFQNWKKRFPEGSSLAGFVVGPEGETLFVGMWDVLKLSRIDGPYDDPLLGHLPAESRALHQTKHSGRMQEYEEKLVIEWGNGKRTFRQRAHLRNKIVQEIRAQAKDEPFPLYINLFRRLGDLSSIYPSWQVRLKERKGVYLLTFDDGMQYVGSATGEQGFWQRWSDYLTNGNGGNRVLIRDQRDARVAWVSILEVSGSAQTGQDIVNQEMCWKKKLGIRAKALDNE